MAQKPSLPKGTRDFSPTEVAKRTYIINSVSKHFKNFGFQPIETPSFENSDTLLGKYGEEGDRLIFKILNSGEYLNKVDNVALEQKEYSKINPAISEKALRYDLTVPFARYVVQHQNEIEFPFKRFQIQPVWRADRPQKGRYREFYQCDADVVGSASLWQEVEFIQLYDGVFSDLKLQGATVKMNNRKILSGIAQTIGASDKLIDFTVALDKLDKIGADGVKQEMRTKGITDDAIKKLEPLFSLNGTIQEKLQNLKSLLSNSEIGLKGIDELAFIADMVGKIGLQAVNLDLDVTLARGLNYYTGAIFEVSAPPQVKLGSIGGGGRYDDLTGIFGLKNISGVGISFGLDRIYLVLEELQLFPEEVTETTKVFFINFGDTEALYCYQTIQKLRAKGISAEIFPDSAKMKKQMNYANKRAFPFVVLAGSSEVENETFTLKNMATGEQSTVDFDQLLEVVS